MSARLPGGRTTEQLVDVLNRLSCVTAMARQTTVEATIERPSVPTAVLEETARSGFALDGLGEEGDCRIAVFSPEDETEGER